MLYHYLKYYQVLYLHLLIDYYYPQFNEDQFNINEVITTKLYDYLIIPSHYKDYKYPIQELIMGSGKSSSVTPLLCLLIINYYKNNMLE